MPSTATTALSPLQERLRSYVAVWRLFLSSRSRRWEALLTALLLPVALLSLASFLTAMEARPGALLADPVLAYFSPRDLTWLTFLFIYAALVLALVVLLRHPRHLLLAVQSYIVMVVIRMMLMAVTPLDPPDGLIPLRDPLVEFFGTTGMVLTRDLFFSGHTATLFLLVLVTPARRLKVFFLACTAGVALCVIWQHVHYTTDVLVAPLASYAAYRLVRSAPWH